MLQPKTIAELDGIVETAATRLAEQAQRADRVSTWLRPKLATGFTVPAHASTEHRRLAELSRTPWLGLVVTTAAQALRVDGMGGTDEDTAKAAWDLWTSSRLSASQSALYRDILAYGHAYGVVTPAVDADGSPTARIRFRSSRDVYVRYDDIGAPYPSYAVEVLSREGSTPTAVRIYDASAIYTATVVDGHISGTPAEVPHRAGVCPVVRYANLSDLEGGAMGEVEPLIPTAQRINKTTYDRLLAQHFSSWRVRTATGIDLPSTEDGDVDGSAATKLKTKLAQEDMLVAEAADARFGTLDATDLTPFITAWRADVEALAAVSQTPAYALTGQLINLSAEALAAARSPLTQKIAERQGSISVAHGDLLRAAFAIIGHPAARDMHLRPIWADLEIRSMSQAVDALGKAAAMLGVPKRQLWYMLPGVERSTVDAWVDAADADDAADPFLAMTRRHLTPTTDAE